MVVTGIYTTVKFGHSTECKVIQRTYPTNSVQPWTMDSGIHYPSMGEMMLFTFHQVFSFFFFYSSDESALVFLSEIGVAVD